MCPVYILNGISTASLKGRKYAIFCSHEGMKGMGMIIPEKSSPIDEKTTMEPTGRMVINIDIYINIDIDTRTINPRNKETVKSKNAARLPGNAIL